MTMPKGSPRTSASPASSSGSQPPRRRPVIAEDSNERGLLTVRGLSAWYGRSRALFDIDIDVPAGSSVGLMGHNGAGKSTLLRAIGGVHRSKSGEVRLGGEDVAGREAHDVAISGIHLVREGAPIFPGLSIAEHVALGMRLAALRGRPSPSEEEVWAAFPELVKHRKQMAGFLSGGERQLLTLAVAVSSAPSVLLLDEPSVGLAPAAASRMISAARSLQAGGMSLLIAEQRIDLLRQCADVAHVLSIGKVVSYQSFRSEDPSLDAAAHVRE